MNFSKVKILFILITLLGVLAINQKNLIKIESIYLPSDFKSNLDTNYPAYLEILNDTAFETLNFKGDGSDSFPYIIEDYEISNQDYYTGIRISNTTKFCVITNCTIEQLTVGVSIWNASNVAVSKNVVYGCTIEVYVNNCSDVEIEENTFTGSTSTALTIWDSPNTLIENNIIEYSINMGVEISNSQDCIINNNTLLHCEGGIAVRDSLGTIITNNIFILGGITLHSALQKLEDYLTYTLENNTLNSKMIGFFKNKDDLTLTDDLFSQIILINCTYSQISKIDFTNCVTGVIVYFGLGISVFDCTFSDNFAGSIVMFFVDNVYIDSNHILDSNFFPGGILLYESTNCEVIDNTIFECQLGIIFVKIKSGKIFNNEILRCFEASICFYETISCIIQNNNCNKTLQSDSAGIIVEKSFNCSIKYNYIKENNGYGIYLQETEYTSIYSNGIADNSLYGVYVDHLSTNNVIYHNEFMDNYAEGDTSEVNSQAWDSGNYNTWYSIELEEGNFWNEHKGNKPYSIDGISGSKDLYPLGRSPFKTNYGISFIIAISVIVLVTKKQRRKSS